MKLFLFVGLLVFVGANANTSDCPQRDEMIAKGKYDPLDNSPCIDPCDITGFEIKDKANCSLAQYCHWDDEKQQCQSKKLEISPALQQNEQDVTAFTISATVLLPVNTTEGGNGNEVEGKLFNLGGGGSPSYVNPINFQQQFNVFPYNCQINPHDPYLYKLLESPVNVPYCLRIPCSKSDPSLEVNRYGCLSRPGCAYDTQLANLRAAKGHAILPGVPVCHLAIRNKQFHKLVRDYLQKTGSQWNGLYTKCFLKQHGAAILKAPCGCEVIASLQYFGIQPKIAGWPGITKSECHLINGCFKEGRCFFPVTSGKIQIKSAKDTHRSYSQTGRDIYGQPQCLPFDINAKPTDYLSNYHNCHLSGCAMDPSIGFPQIRQHLCQIALSDTVPNYLKQKFWKLVQQGIVRADNWREELNKLRYDTCPPVFSPILPSNLNPFSLRVRRSSGANSTEPRSTSNFFTNYLPGCTPLPGFNQNFPTGINPNPILNPYSLPVSNSQSGPQPNSFTYPNANPNPIPYPNSNPIPYPNSNPNPIPYPNPNPNPIPLPNLFPGFPFPFPGFPSRPTCPYQPLPIHGYAPLTGSFAGCCQRHHCYIPRSTLDSQYSGVASYYADWTTWSDCSASCQGGYRTRSRACVGKGQCEGDHEQQERCNDVACPYFETWGSWGDCSATCGSGTKSRSRVCSPSGSGCSGRAEEERDCNTGACPTLSQWSAYSDCSATCGHGSKTRTRSCIDDGAYGCYTVPANSLVDTKSCEIFCGSAVEVSRTSCTAYPDCHVTIAYECKYDGQPGHCQAFQSSKRERCYNGANCWYLG